MYDQSSILIAFALLTAILVANEVGYRTGRWRRNSADSGTKAQTNAIQAGMLGLLALLLGFTFTMAVQRYDNRSAAVLDEANAIGTAYLRTDLLPDTRRQAAQDMIRDYVRLRIDESTLNLTQTQSRDQILQMVEESQAAIWAIAIGAAAEDPGPVTSGLFIQSLNEMIDAYGARSAALQKHVPEVVLFLLFSVFIIASSVLGYAGGLEGGRPFLATVAMSILIVLVIFIIIDLDRPRRGLIAVSQTSMHALADTVDAFRTR